MPLIGQRVVHPNHFKQLRQFYRQNCTIQRPTESQRTTGEIVTAWESWIVAEPCLLANLPGLGTPETRERRTPEYTEITENWHVTFERAIPDVEVGYQVVVTTYVGQLLGDVRTQTYNVTGVETDSQSMVTRLKLEVVDF